MDKDVTTAAEDADDIRRNFWKEGFVVIPSLVDAKTIAAAKVELEKILATDNISNVAELERSDGQTPRRIWKPTERSEVFRNLAEDTRVLDAVESVIGGNLSYHYSKLHMKGAKVGSAVKWHQDFSYYPHTNTDLLTALIYLDDADEQNGCLQVVPGSHKGGLISHEVDGEFRGMVPSGNAQEFEERGVFAGGPAGTVVLLHCLALHASAANKSERPRRTFLTAYRASDALPIYYGPHAAHNEAGVRVLRGEPALSVRVTSGIWRLPITSARFGSLFQIQEGSHYENDGGPVGYAT